MTRKTHNIGSGQRTFLARLLRAGEDGLYITNSIRRDTIARLVARGLIVSTRSGHRLTAAGRRVAEECSNP